MKSAGDWSEELGWNTDCIPDIRRIQDDATAQLTADLDAARAVADAWQNKDSQWRERAETAERERDAARRDCERLEGLIRTMIDLGCVGVGTTRCTAPGVFDCDDVCIMREQMKNLRITAQEPSDEGSGGT